MLTKVVIGNCEKVLKATEKYVVTNDIHLKKVLFVLKPTTWITNIFTESLACTQTLVTAEERKERNYLVCATA